MDRNAWIGILLAVLGSKTEKVDRHLWHIGVLGSECLDQHSSRHAWIGVLLVVLGSETERVDRRLWRIDVLGSAFFSSCLDRSSSRHRAPCLDRNFRKFGIKRSENVGIERSFREDSRIESHEWRERGS